MAEERISGEPVAIGVAQRRSQLADQKVSADLADRCYNTGMATQLRDYRIRAGELDRFVDEWRTGVAPLRRANGFEITGAWTIPEEDRFVWLLAHPGDWDAFAEADAAYYASPERAALDPDPARLIDGQRNVRLSEVEPA